MQTKLNIQKKPRYDFLITTTWEGGHETTETIQGTHVVAYPIEGFPVISIFDENDEVYLQNFSAEVRVKRLGQVKKAVRACES